ncbi:MAG: tyrosine-type recombinase/integrase [Geobacter sp.]|nr:MAG: tyrosine-type recombinase/integrase [Geobacter sp.]
MQRKKRFPFTKRAIELLPAHEQSSPSREAEYTDTECRGLHLRVSKNGRRFFQHRYKILGRKKCMALGEFPAVSVQDARQRVLENKALLARDKDPAGERTRAKGELTFAEFATQHYLPHAREHKKTWDDDEWKVEKVLNPALGKLRLSCITQRDVAQLHAREKARTSAVSANHVLSTLKRMLTLAVKWEFLEKNPAAAQEKFKEPPQRERYLSEEEIPRFLAALGENEDGLSVAAIRLLLCTGCRHNEVVSLRWEQVRLDEGRFLLRETKNGRSRSVHLNAMAMEVLKELAERRDQDERTRTSEFVFPSRQGTAKGHLYDLRNPFERACREAGIENFRVHDMRHTFASVAVRAGASLFDVQKLLGHQDIAMTQRYAHLSADGLKEATEKVSSLLGQSAA